MLLLQGLQIKIINFHDFLLFQAILIFCLVLTGQAQMLTPFTFHDIQHRVGDFSAKTLQIETSVLPPATSQIGEVSPVSTFQKTSSNSRPTFPRNSSPPISLNPFESSSVANDPSSFVSSLTSLHLHLTKDETASDNRCQIHQHFISSFFVWKCFVLLFSSNVLAPEFLAQNFHTKYARIKCWWNWRQVSISSTFSKQLLRTNVFCAALPKVLRG